MAHIFKPGDKAYWIGVGWRELIENHEGDSSLYPLRSKDSLVTFTADGRRYARGGDVVLLPINPYDPNDPKNPPEFRYPFMLNGRPVKVGDEVIYKRNGEPVDGQVYGLGISEGRPWAVIHYNSCSSATLGFDSGHLCWPDELPVKKKVAKWAHLVIGIPGTITVGFTEEMTQEEARRAYGSSIRMIPGTEREVEP